MVLESAGYSVLVANDFRRRNGTLRLVCVDMVVSDHFLQDGTGIELATAMKKLKPDVPNRNNLGAGGCTGGHGTRRPVHLVRGNSPTEFCRRYQNFLIVAIVRS